MSQENVEIVRRLYDAAAHRDVESVLALYDPEVEFDASRHPLTSLIGGTRVYRGHEGVRSFFRQRHEAFESVEDACDELIDAGDRVVSVWSARARGRASGVDVKLAGSAAVWTIREGRIVRVVFFPTREEALEAAGLREQAMSQGGLEIVRRHVEAFGRDAATALCFLDPYVVWDTSRVGGADPAYGLEGVTQAARRYLGAFEEYAFEVERLSDLGSGCVLATVTESGRGKSSGVPVRRSFAALYTVLDGRIARITTFPSEDEALKAAGLRV
jgi:ketosteroid isomerase-like protein